MIGRLGKVRRWRSHDMKNGVTTYGVRAYGTQLFHPTDNHSDIMFSVVPAPKGKMDTVRRTAGSGDLVFVLDEVPGYKWSKVVYLILYKNKLYRVLKDRIHLFLE